MAHPERTPNNLGLVSKAMERLAKIADVKYPPISDNARWVTQMLEKELYTIEVIDPVRELVQPWVIDFQVKEDPISHQPEGVLVIDPYRMSAAKIGTIDSELVRTVSVAVQYPGRGFNRPLREVYNEAVEIQKTWLEANHATATLLDPRMYDREVLIKNLMGPEAYYSDFSFGNWIAALASMQKDRIGAMSEDSAIQLKAISELMNDHNAFVLWRTKMVPDRDLNRPMAEILVESFERYPFAVLAEKNAFHAASTALNERI
ncbi:MAG: hypothetical protein WBC38_01125 [Microgenomates group bacterium]|jgi:hypothetical protein|nr:hypothetical protein [Candidatus Woesebacteria bacterium]